MRIFIIGFKSSGKTTLGKKLAQMLNMDFVDVDEYIENISGRSVIDLFSLEGEEKFRNIEWKALLKAAEKNNVVISTGGGAPCWYENMNLMLQKGITIYIRLDDDTLISRLKKATADRPIVRGKSDEELRDYVSNLKKTCEHHYLRAHHVIDGKDLKVNTIIEKLKL